MCGLILLSIGTFVGIMVCVFAVSEAYASGGILGILALIGCVIFSLWIAAKDLKYKEDKDKHHDK